VRNVVVALLVAAVLALAGCGRSAADERPSGPTSRIRIPRDVHSKVELGATTPAAIEQLFGAPDQRAADGALVYENQRVRPNGKTERETTTFRFQGGVLSKVCQSRS
jgi:hypothetical protein